MHYPQSFEHSTLGGWIATRAGGHFATLYSHIDDLVQAVRMVTPAGDLRETRRAPGVEGPGRLPSGSSSDRRGRSASSSRRGCSKRPATAAHVPGALGERCAFETFQAGAAASRAIAQSGLYPSNCRLLDAHEALLAGVPATTAGRCSCWRSSLADGPQRASIDRAVALAKAAGGSAAPVQERTGDRGADARGEAWRRSFVDAPYLQSALVSLGVIADTFETACTWDRFEGLHAEVTAAVEGAMRGACGRGSLSCRFTHVYPDGPAPYFTFVAPGRPGEELAQWAVIKRAAMDALAAGGATVTHHHAVGRLHRPGYERGGPAALRREHSGRPKGVMDPAGS